MFLAWVSRYSSANRSNSAMSTASGSRVAVGRRMGDDLVDQIERPMLALHVDSPEIFAEDGQADQLGGREEDHDQGQACLLYTSPSPRDRQKSRMPSSA